jgi:hypothetical protein
LASLSAVLFVSLRKHIWYGFLAMSCSRLVELVYEAEIKLLAREWFCEFGVYGLYFWMLACQNNKNDGHEDSQNGKHEQADGGKL